MKPNKPKLYTKQKGTKTVTVSVRLDPQSVIGLAGLIASYHSIVGRKVSHTAIFRRLLQVANSHIGDALALPPKEREEALAKEREATVRLTRGASS